MRLTNYIRDSFIRNVKNQLPEKKWPHINEVQKLVLEKMDPVIRAVYDNENLRPALQTSSYYKYDGYDGRGQVIIGNVKLDDVLKPWHDHYTKVNETIGKIRAAAYSATTLKQLREVLPDLVEYMPDETGKPATKGVPMVVSVKEDLKELGFPKDGE